MFEKLERDYKDVKYDLEEQVTIVQDIGDSRSERVPWLYDLTGFPYYLTMLKDKEIWSSYKLPPKKELNASSEGTKDPDLVRILVAAKAVLRDIYQLYSNILPDRKMIQQRANILTLTLVKVVELTVNSVLFVWYGDRDVRDCRSLELTVASINPNPIYLHQIQ